jgi:glycosyltransferase involved in cell wall biosynthesis
MPATTENTGFEPVAAGETALIIRRGPCTYDSRIMREADTLRRLGYRPELLGVISERVTERHSVQEGTRITRLAPTSPFAWLSSRLLRSDRARADGTRPSREDAPAMALAIRLHRWIRTLDFYRRAIGVVRRERPALIHCNDYNTMWVGVAARAVGGIAVLYDSHELWPDRNMRPEPRWWLLACEALFVRCAHRTITASPGYAEVMARRHRIASPKVVRNIPVSNPPSGEAASGTAADAPGGTSPGEDSLALYAGALTSGRGLEISIRALARVRGARLRLVGPARDDYRASLAELARREGVADRVEFAGAVPPEKLLETISAASVGLALIQPVCLSYRMSLPNKLFEYVAAGVPVLGSDLPAIGALVREHEIGLVAQPDQVADVASKLSEMLEPKRNDAFRRATRRAAERLNWTRESQLLADAYLETARAAGQGASR